MYVYIVDVMKIRCVYSYNSVRGMIIVDLCINAYVRFFPTNMFFNGLSCTNYDARSNSFSNIHCRHVQFLYSRVYTINKFQIKLLIQNY